MKDDAFKSGEEQARRDIAAGRLQLHYQLRGEWGRDLQETFRTRFAVEVIELTSFTTEQESSFQAGYDAAVTAHIDRVFGKGSVVAAYEEVQTRRKKRYDEWVATTRMSYASITDSKFLATAESWFCSQPELLGLIRYSHAGGNREFEFFSSFHAFSERLGQLPHLACVILFRQPQLPLRGVVDDAFIARCLRSIPDGAEYLVTETVRRVYGAMSWFHNGSGKSHAEMRDDLEECRGAPVAAGLYPPWLHDTEDVISAVVPDEQGVARSGIY